MAMVPTGWPDYRREHAIAYSIEEKPAAASAAWITAGSHGNDRRRLAARAYRLGRAALREIAPIATPDTLFRWHRQLTESKWMSDLICAIQHRDRLVGRVQTSIYHVRLGFLTRG